MSFRPINRRSLPQPVLDRLAAVADELFDDRRDRRPAGPPDQIRVQLRTLEDGGAPELYGYATVFDVWYDVAGGPPWGWRERFAAGSLDRTLAERDDVRLLVNHDGVPLARTRSRTLTLEADQRGLLTNAPALDRANPTVTELVSAMQRGDIDEMSLAFMALRQEWNADYTERTILEARLFDVSVVTYPANPNTLAQLRAMLEGGADPATAGIVVGHGAVTGNVSLTGATAPALDLSLATAMAEASRLRGQRYQHLTRL